ncbi:MAG: L,D-transpeptidase family protein [Acidimicrobiales bacterium]
MAVRRSSSGRRRRLSNTVSGAAFLLVALVACSSGGGDEECLSISSQAESDVTTSSTSTSTSTTTTIDTTTTTEEPPPPGLGPGDSGPVVAALEQKLDSLKYDVGSVDEEYDQTTAYGVTAFQKITGADPTGRATDDVIAAVNAATSSPTALMPGGGADRVEVDLERQVLFLYQGDALYKILTVSTGNGQRFCSEGWCRRADTNPGSFKVYRQAQGWEEGPLGSLYNPNYFDGGIAIHGSRSVPASPASHGCVRIPMSAAEWFPSFVPLGTPVYVAGPDGIPPPLPEAPPEIEPEVVPPDGPTPTEPAATTTLPPGVYRPPRP